jgi:hypothetical protein
MKVDVAVYISGLPGHPWSLIKFWHMYLFEGATAVNQVDYLNILKI